MASGFNFPPPTGAPNVNSSTPLRPYYGSPLDSPLQQYYQHTSQLEEELSHHSELNSQEAARELLSYGMIKYLTLAIATPFENAQTLLQVQYLPNDDGASSSGNGDSRAAEVRQYTNWVYEILHLFAQPTLEATLNDTFDLYDDTIPLVHLDRFGPNMATMVTSHLVVGLILSPLELVRTRLVVQTADPTQRKYTGMLNCISTIISEEGVSALWGGVNLVPTVLYHTLTPLITNSIPLVIDRVFNISASDSPLLFSVAELGLETLDLLIRLPLETVRKRLQIQIQAKIPGKRYETVIETRKRPYAGVIDCVYKIIQEEGGQHKRLSSKKSDDGEVRFVDRPWYSSWGVRGLYTGLGMHLTSNLAMFAVGAVTNLQDDGDDW
ncbi:MAG: mitochondrial carrier domain-containing protein [Linnemannia elongata]|nr:MAG: mitochondrial carrier domain-containing protein [Linnemannia elongata]